MFENQAKKLVRLIHGSRRNADGFLLTSRHYIDEDQEVALGQSYLGLAGLPVFLLIVFYTVVVYGEPTGRGYRARFANFADMPTEIQLLLPIAVVAHLTAMASMFRLVFHWSAISSQHQSNLEN